jgi:hypothetical protein
MVKLITAMLMLTGCVSYSPTQTVDSKELIQLRSEITEVKDLVNGRLLQIDYFIEHDKCFISYGICLGEGKMPKKACWDRHEQCVVSVYKKWKTK